MENVFEGMGDIFGGSEEPVEEEESLGEKLEKLTKRVEKLEKASKGDDKNGNR